MAKLKSPFKLSGTIDDASFLLQKDGSVHVQGKPGPTREQVKKGKNFDLTRRNSSEFGGATQDAMLLRRVLGSTVRALRDARLNSHVNKRVYQVAKSDTVSMYGRRHANAGNIQLLEGFDYNHLLGLDTALPVKPEHSMDAVTGVLRLYVPGCIVRRKKIFPAEATHYKIVSCAGAVHFGSQDYTRNIAETDLLPLGKPMPAVDLVHSLHAIPGQVLLHIIGIVFYKMEDDYAQLLRGGALKIVQVARMEEMRLRKYRENERDWGMTPKPINMRSCIKTLIIPIVLLLSCNSQDHAIKQPDNTNQTADSIPGGKIAAGAICTVEDGDGKFGIIKVLVIDDEIAHVRIYKNKYDHRPAKVDLTTLSLGSITDKDGAGVGHSPLARAGFDNWKPVVIAYQQVTKEELEGYEIWKSQ